MSRNHRIVFENYGTVVISGNIENIEEIRDIQNGEDSLQFVIILSSGESVEINASVAEYRHPEVDETPAHDPIENIQETKPTTFEEVSERIDKANAEKDIIDKIDKSLEENTIVGAITDRGYTPQEIRHLWQESRENQ